MKRKTRDELIAEQRECWRRINELSRLIGQGPLETKTIEITKQVVTRVAAEWKIRPAQITGHGRKEPFVTARQVSMWFLRTKFHLAFREISAAFGCKHHGTTMHAMNKVNDLLDVDSQFAASVQRVREQIA